MLNRSKLSIVGLGLVVVIAGVGVCSALQKEYKSGVIWQEPAIVTPAETPGGPPSDAIVLFDGKDLSKWVGGADWKIENGYATVQKRDISTKDSFGDCQLHVEFATPEKVVGSGQGRGNSGIFLMNHYEVQVLDSFDSKTYIDGQCGSIYKQTPPMVNVCRKPGEWQTYDIVFEAPKFDESGKVTKPAIITVFQNGVLVQNHFALDGSTNFDKPAAYVKHAERLPIRLQNHNNPVKFRNIWIREIKPMVGKKPEPKDPKE